MPGLRSRRQSEQKERAEDLKFMVEKAIEDDEVESAHKKLKITYEGGGKMVTVRGSSITSFVPPEQEGMWPGEAE